MSDLNKLEQAAVAASKGNLTQGGMSIDLATASGWAGRTNPLGFYIKKYFSEEPPTQETIFGIVLTLSDKLVKNGITRERAYGVGFDSLMFWRDGLCPYCRGVAQVPTCHHCDGTGERDVGRIKEDVRKGVLLLKEAAEEYDRQLNKMTKELTYLDHYQYKVNVSMRDLMDDHGFNKLPMTARKWVD